MVAVPFDWLDRFDWNNPFTKLMSFSLLGLAAFLGRRAVCPPAHGLSDELSPPAWLDMLLGLSMLMVVTYQYNIPSAFVTNNGRFSDMGAVTHDAARRLFIEGENPYHGHYANHFTAGYGYRYGPVTILGHALAILSPQGQTGMRIANLALLCMCSVLVTGLAYQATHVRSWALRYFRSDYWLFHTVSGLNPLFAAPMIYLNRSSFFPPFCSPALSAGC